MGLGLLVTGVLHTTVVNVSSYLNYYYQNEKRETLMLSYLHT